MKVFISHSSYDKWVARQISKELEARDHTTFLDEKDIKTGDSIDSEIQKHLKESDDLLVLISPVALKSHWVFIEIGGAKALGKKIIPILFHIQPNELPQAITSLLAKDLNDIEKYYSELSERVGPAGGKTSAAGVGKRVRRDVVPQVRMFGGFSAGQSIKIIDGALLTAEDKQENPKWVRRMDKYSGAHAKIVGFNSKGYAILDVDDREFFWHTKWLRGQ